MRLLLTAAIASLALLTQPAVSQTYPSKPIHLLVPYAPGGIADIAARIVGAKLTESWGQQVVVESRPGGNGFIAMTAAAKSPADGYTLVMATVGDVAINPALFKDLRYDPQKDFDLLTVAVRTPNVLVANPAFPVNSVRELIEHLKKNPDKVTFASSGTGSSDHLTAALFWQKTGTTGIHVPYRGGGPAINDLVAGHASVSFQNLGAIAEQVRAGKLKALAVTGDRRAAALPDVPTIAEAGVTGLEVRSWNGLFAPAGTPREIVEKVSADVKKVLLLPQSRQKLALEGAEPEPNSPQAFAAFVNADIAKWLDLAQKAGIKLVN